MKLLIHSKNLQLTEALNHYIEQKIGDAVEHFLPDQSDIKVHIHVFAQKRNHGIEITVPLGHLTIRAEEKTEDLYTSIDLAEEKLKRQFRKYKTRVNRRSRKEQWPYAQKTSIEKENHEEVVKVKEVWLKPMSREEAVLQMNLLDHTFFVFLDETTDKVSVVYKRKDKEYGVLTAV
ncbi:ribosome hibernation-promoting factor, HPF/YfiA family [Fictibacillus sp. NRS-1165]|uniref:ribosome hibernation-promoting factor, HPF/YfiA family n=1 Tax=Fictibacillus sp. NRS-1165 TaxID=3144463 RepID=UPI003D1D5D04